MNTVPKSEVLCRNRTTLGIRHNEHYSFQMKFFGLKVVVYDYRWDLIRSKQTLTTSALRLITNLWL